MGVRRPASTALLFAALSVACGAVTPGVAHATTALFGYTGGEQAFTVPPRVTSLHVVAIGGRGGNGREAIAKGGFGAAVRADLAVRPGQVLYVEVGGDGASAPTDDLDSSGVGGFNGGAVGGTGGFDGRGAGGGGGASDVRTAPLSLGPASLPSRLVIAGGGGGSGGFPTGGAGGAAGADGSNGGAAIHGSAGTTTIGGAGGGTGDTRGASGALGVGGDGGPGDFFFTSGGGGGGGGGAFGGGGGSAGAGNGSPGAGGGGGSSGFGPGVTAFSVHGDSTGIPSVSFTYVKKCPKGKKLRTIKKNGKKRRKCVKRKKR